MKDLYHLRSCSLKKTKQLTFAMILLMAGKIRTFDIPNVCQSEIVHGYRRRSHGFGNHQLQCTAEFPTVAPALWFPWSVGEDQVGLRWVDFSKPLQILYPRCLSDPATQSFALCILAEASTRWLNHVSVKWQACSLLWLLHAMRAEMAGILWTPEWVLPRKSIHEDFSVL